MTTHNRTVIPADLAFRIASRLKDRGFEPNENGEIIAFNFNDWLSLRAIIDCASYDYVKATFNGHVVVMEGYAKAALKLPPVATLAQYGYDGEGRAFPVAGDHSLSLVRAAVRDLGGDWRLWASVEDDGGEGRPPRFRCVVGRANPWSYPSSVEAAGEVEFKAIENGLAKDPVRDALHLAQGMQAAGLDFDETEAQRLARVTSFDVPAFLREASDTLAKALEDGTAMRTETERVIERVAEFTRETLARLHALKRA